jgi:repressor LexA
MLTQRQKELLDFMLLYKGLNGVYPSYAESAKALKLKSRSGVHRLTLKLEERGYIKRIPNRARAVEVIKYG